MGQYHISHCNILPFCILTVHLPWRHKQSVSIFQDMSNGVLPGVVGEPMGCWRLENSMLFSQSETSLKTSCHGCNHLFWCFFVGSEQARHPCKVINCGGLLALIISWNLKSKLWWSTKPWISSSQKPASPKHHGVSQSEKRKIKKGISGLKNIAIQKLQGATQIAPT